MSNSTNLATLATGLTGNGSGDFTSGLGNALRVTVAGSGDSPAMISFYNDTGGTLYGVLAQGGASVPVDTTATIDAVKVLAGGRETIVYPCRSDIWDLGTWAVLSSTSGEVTIAGSSAGIITRVNFPTIP